MAHIFISYSHKDSEYAHRLADSLQSQGFDVWIDARLDYGSHWPVELQKQLDSCDAFILIMSPHSYNSEWVQSELQRAKRKLKPIFPLLLDGDETWLSVESTQYYDVRGGKIPDAKFFSDISSVVPHSGKQVARRPVSEINVVPMTSAANLPKPRGGISPVSLALISIVAIAVLAAAILITWSISSRGSAPSAVGNLETSTATASSDNLATPGPTTTETSPVKTATMPDSSEMVDSKGVPMHLIPAGNFIAGSNSGYDNEKPVHTVYLDDFYIDKYEVTNVLYKACVDAGVCQPPEKTGSFTRSNYFGNPEYDNYPVVFVTWEDAQSYCQWRGMKLPTEAQWEKAARGTDGRVYPWGNDMNQNNANFHDTVGDTSPVGSYENGKSPYGVYDMAGNAWEWVADWYSDTYYLDTPLTNPTGPASGEYRVLRGGSWHDDSTIITTSNRGWNQLEYFENTDFGFRCATDGTP